MADNWDGLIFQQCEDLLVLQSEALSRIQHENFKKRQVVDEEYVAKLQRDLQIQKSEHEKTQLQLSLTKEKLQVFETQSQLLTKQLQREKDTFENAFGILRSKALTQSSQANDLAAKCAAMEAVIAKQQGDIYTRDELVASLQSKIKEMKSAHRKEIDELSIRVQQEMFIAKQKERKLTAKK